jgi:hypothetical protein
MEVWVYSQAIPCGIWVHKIAVSWVLLQILQVSAVIIILPILMHILSSVTDAIVLAIGSVVK